MGCPSKLQNQFLHLYARVLVSRTGMANTPQAKKRIRRNTRRAEINGNRIGRIRTYVKKVEAALAAGDKDAASEAIAQVQPDMARGVAKGEVGREAARESVGEKG